MHSNHQLEPKVIPISRTKVFLSLLLFIGLLLLGIHLLSLEPEAIREIRHINIPFIVYGIAIVNIIMSTIMSTLLTIRFFHHSSGMTINMEGLQDNSMPFSTRFVSWSDIEAATEHTSKGFKLIHLHIRNPENYYKNRKFQSWLIVQLGGNFNRPFTVSAGQLKIDHETLLRTIRTYYQASQGHYLTTMYRE